MSDKEKFLCEKFPVKNQVEKLRMVFFAKDGIPAGG